MSTHSSTHSSATQPSPPSPYPQLLLDPPDAPPPLSLEDFGITDRPLDDPEHLLEIRNRYAGSQAVTERISRALHTATQLGSGTYGHTVLWNIASGITVDRTLFAQLIDDAVAISVLMDRTCHPWLRNLLTRYLPRPLTPPVAVLRGLETYVRLYQPQSTPLLVRRVADSSHAGCYALVQERSTGTDLDYTTVCKVEWYRHEEADSDVSGQYEVRVLAQPEWADEVHSIYSLIESAQQVYTASDISSMFVTTLVSVGAVGLRAQGGVYFVPVGSEPLLDTLAVLISLLPKDSNFGCFPVPRIETNADFLVCAVAEHLLHDLRDLERDVAQREQTAKRAATDTSGKRKGVSAKTVDAYRLRVVDLHAKIARYVDLLDLNATSVTDALTRVEQRLSALEQRSESPFDGL